MGVFSISAIGLDGDRLDDALQVALPQVQAADLGLLVPQYASRRDDRFANIFGHVAHVHVLYVVLGPLEGASGFPLLPSSKIQVLVGVHNPVPNTSYSGQ